MSSLYDLLKAHSLHDVFQVLADYQWEQVNWVHFSIEAFLAIFVVIVLLQKRFRIRRHPSDKLTEEEIDALCKEWKPTPVIPEMTDLQQLNLRTANHIVTSAPGRIMQVDGKSMVNLATQDYLGFQSRPDMVELAENTVRKYGCGTCGPRGFYGTLDVHLELEGEIADWLGVDDAVLYSSNMVTLSSAIPAFLKMRDTIYCDRGVSLPLHVGVTLSRSRVIYFDHNNMEQLEEALERVRQEDARKSTKLYRKFLIIEGLYTNYGDVAPLPQIMKLKEKYKFRIMMDDSHGIGVLGANGRGTTEHFGIEPAAIDLISGSLGTCLAGIGGYTAGSAQFAMHQRLTSSGYVFSASTPAYLASVPIEAVKMIRQSGGKLQSELQERVRAFWAALSAQGLAQVRFDGLAGVSPLVHMRLARPPATRIEQEQQLQSVVDAAAQDGLLLVRCCYSAREPFIPDPSVRLSVTLHHTAAQLEDLADRVGAAVRKALPN